MNKQEIVNAVAKRLGVTRARAAEITDLFFAQGGIMPGAKGQPGLAVLHGGERVIPNGGGQAIQLNIDGRSFMTWLVDYSRDAGGIPITTRAAS